MSVIATKTLRPLTAPKPTSRFILCVFAIALDGTASTSPVLAEHPHSVRKRDQVPNHTVADAARPQSKNYRLQSDGSDVQSATSPQKSGLGAFLIFLAALLASLVFTFPRGGATNSGHTRVARLQRFASYLMASATLLMAATGAGIALVALIARHLPRPFGSRLAGEPCSMPKSQRLVQRRAS